MTCWRIRAVCGVQAVVVNGSTLGKLLLDGQEELVDCRGTVGYKYLGFFFSV